MDPLIEFLRDGPKDAVAIEDARGTWTRGDLIAATEKVLAGLRHRKIEPGDRVSVIVRPAAETVAAMLGARAAGAMVCLVDPRQAVHLLPQQQPKLVIADDSFGHPNAISIRALLESSGATLTGSTSTPSAWGISTSGSSGRTRTVVLAESQVSFLTPAMQEYLCYTPADRVLCAVPLHHVYGFMQLWSTLATGASLLLPPIPLLPGPLVEWTNRSTVLPGVPAMLRTLMGMRRRLSVRLVTLSGQGTGPEHRAAFAAAFPGVPFMQFYGLTEGPRILWVSPDDFFSRPDSCGRPTRGLSVTLDPSGELLAEGPNISLGYLDDPEATASRFQRSVLRTGDLFRRDGDMFCYVGRSDGVFKRMGEKVVPEVVEAALGSHPQVERCLVTAEPDALGEFEPVAWVVPRTADLDPNDVLRHLRRVLSSAMVPARLVIVPELATTASGKVVRKRPTMPR